MPKQNWKSNRTRGCWKNLWSSMEKFNGEDQLLNLINGLKNDPNSRRHIISS